MKKPLFGMVTAGHLLLALAVSGNATGATSVIHIVQVTDNGSRDWALHMSNGADRLLWAGNMTPESTTSPTDWEVFLYESGAPEQLTVNDVGDIPSDISHNGAYMTWGSSRCLDASNSEIVTGSCELWRQVVVSNGVNHTLLTGGSDTRRGSSFVNNQGDVTWVELATDYSSNRILLHSGATGSTTPLSGWGSVGTPCISDAGEVVWHQLDGTDTEIWRFDGNAATPLTDNEVPDWYPLINADGQVVWARKVVPAEVMELVLRDGALERILTEALTSFSYALNGGGDVAWAEPAGVFLYNRQANSTTQIGAGSGVHDVVLNRAGQAAWTRYNGAEWTIEHYDGDSEEVLADDVVELSSPLLSESGAIAWLGYDGTDSEVFLARRLFRWDVVTAVQTYPWDLTPTMVQRIRELAELHWPVGPGRPKLWEPGPAPNPCPECRFSGTWQPRGIPPALQRLYQFVPLVFTVPVDLDGLRKRGPLLVAAVEGAPLGPRFSREMRESVVKELRSLGEADTPDLRASLTRALNALELDWRVPPDLRSPTAAPKGERQRVELGGVASVEFEEVTKMGQVRLNIQGDPPAWAPGLDYGWPVAVYDLSFSGSQRGNVGVTLPLGASWPAGERRTARLLQWDGKTLRDITTVVDEPRGLIRGRTRRLSSFLVAKAAPRESQKPR